MFPIFNKSKHDSYYIRFCMQAYVQIWNDLRKVEFVHLKIFHVFLKNNIKCYNFLFHFCHHFYKLVWQKLALFERSLLIMLVRWESIALATSFTIFTGILSGPVAFLGFKPLIILLICPTLVALILKLLSYFECVP